MISMRGPKSGGEVTVFLKDDSRLGQDAGFEFRWWVIWIEDRRQIVDFKSDEVRSIFRKIRALSAKTAAMGSPT